MKYEKLTRKILDKKEEELTADEKEMVDSYKKRLDMRYSSLEKENENIKKLCPMLCSGPEQNLIPSYGWIEPVKNMTFNLEYLNMKFKKYGYKIVFDQTKEKFGTFRGYWNIVKSPIGFFGPLARFFSNILEKIRNVDFGRTWVVDKEEYSTLEWRGCSEESFKNRTNTYGAKIAKFKEIEDGEDTSEYETTTYFKKTSDGKYMMSYPLYHPRKTHVVINKHKILWKLQSPLASIVYFLSGLHKYTKEEDFMFEYLEHRVSDIVAKCEHDCSDRCEECGAFIGHGSYKARCETHGWVSYICEDCADVRGGMWFNEKTEKWYKNSEECKNPYKKMTKNSKK